MHDASGDERFANIGHRLFITIGTATLVAVGFSLIATLTVAFGSGSEALDRVAWSLPRLYVFYLVAALMAGTLVGLLLPLARHRWGAGAVGLIGGSSVFALLFASLDLDSAGGNMLGNAIFSLVPGGLLGIPLGLYFWKEPDQGGR